MELINPISRDQMVCLGSVLEINEGSHVIDFGSGFAEMLILWAENFGISGAGVEFRSSACVRARRKLEQRGFADRIEIIEGDASGYEFEKHSYDVACCIGASFIWKGFRNSLKAMREALLPGGQIAIAEPYWCFDEVPDEIRKREKDAVHTESELVKIVRKEEFELKYMIRASQEGWDSYESGNWRGLIQWLKENPHHPEQQDVIDHLHRIQDDYVRYARRYVGLVVMVLDSSV